MRIALRALWAAILTVSIVAPAYAQAIGAIHGTVTDNTGAVMPGVTVTVAGTGLQQPLVATTTQSGTYSFPNVPIGTYSVTFELSGFKKISREGIILTSGFNAPVDGKMEIGGKEETVTVISESPLVDTKKTTTGGDFTTDQMLKIPTARDPWQVINMAPGIVLSGPNVGGSASGQQLTVSAFGSSNSVQWNLEGGNITDMSSNSSSVYFNFDSFQEIQVVTGGGDVSVQSSGVFINLITKSGSNVLKGGADTTFENHAMQGNNVSQAAFNTNLAAGATGGLSGAPINRIANYDGDLGGPVLKNKLWYWGSTDYQDINAGVVGYFDKTKAGCNPPPNTFDQLKAVQNCLANDKTVIQDFNGKLNYQLNTTNKFQFLAQTDNKLRNNRGAASTRTNDATTSQFSSGFWRFEDPTYQLTHTWLPTDKLVFVNQMTNVHGGFFLDTHDTAQCGPATYDRAIAGQEPTDPTCRYNIQSLTNRTTSLNSRSLGTTYQTVRPSWEVKSDVSYFMPHKLGGDHAFKFGVGWRKDPVMSFSHVPGGANVTVQCSGNVLTSGGNTCSDASPFVAAGSPAASGLVPRSAFVARDSLVNYNWWTWNSYLQDSYTSKRLTVTGGVRQDWQDSRFLGGCVNANAILPQLLPQQCQDAVGTGQSFNNWSPRVSATYDVTGHGSTAIHGSYSYYYQSKITLANGFDNLQLNNGSVGLTYGSNNSDGSCSAAANSSCWNDANHDGFVQANELSGTPTPSTARFVNGVLTNAIPTIDPNLKLSRTREAVAGVDHQVAGNLHVAVDYIYRKYDLGSQSFINGVGGNGLNDAPGGNAFPASSLWTGPFTFTDPQTGITAPYFVAVPNVVFPTGSTVSATSPAYATYKGSTVTVTKRLSNRWQGSMSYTWSDYRGFLPAGSFGANNAQAGNPTGIQFQNNGLVNGIGGSTTTNQSPRYTVKGYASYEMPWYGLLASMNLNINDGNIRVVSVNGPGQISNCPPGTAAAACTGNTITYTTLAFQNVGDTRLPATKVVDLAVAKNFDIGRQKLTVTLNCFNCANTSTILGYSSNVASNNGVNGASSTFLAINNIIPPRVFRIDLRYAF